MQNNMGLQEKLTLTKYDSGGNVMETRVPYTGSLWCRITKALGMTKYCNDIVLDTGLADVADMIMDRYGYMGFGSGQTIPEHDDTGLETPLFSRVLCTKSIATTFYPSDTARFQALITPTNNTIFYEAILASNDVSGGDDVVFARETFVPIAVDASESMIAVWDIVVMR